MSNSVSSSIKLKSSPNNLMDIYMTENYILKFHIHNTNTSRRLGLKKKTNKIHTQDKQNKQCN